MRDSRAQHSSFPQLLGLVAVHLGQGAQLLWTSSVKWVKNTCPASLTRPYDNGGYLSFPSPPLSRLFSSQSDQHPGYSPRQAVRAGAAQKLWRPPTTDESAQGLRAREGKLTEQISKYNGNTSSNVFHHQRGALQMWKEGRLERIMSLEMETGGIEMNLWF